MRIANTASWSSTDARNEFRIGAKFKRTVLRNSSSDYSLFSSISRSAQCTCVLILKVDRDVTPVHVLGDNENHLQTQEQLDRSLQNIAEKESSGEQQSKKVTFSEGSWNDHTL